MLNSNSPISYWLANIFGTGSIIASVLGYLPALGASVALIWYLIQISESNTVQTWIKNRRVRRLAKLKARAILLEAKLKQPETPSDFG